MTVATEQGVVARVAIQLIVAFQAGQQVVGSVALDHVIAFAGLQHHPLDVRDSPDGAVVEDDLVDGRPVDRFTGEVVGQTDAVAGRGMDDQVAAAALDADRGRIDALAEDHAIELGSCRLGSVVDHIVAMPDLEQVGVAATAADQRVVADATDQGVIAVVAHQHIVASATGQLVVTCQAMDAVVARQGIDGVARNSAEHKVVAFGDGGSGQDVQNLRKVQATTIGKDK